MNSDKSDKTGNRGVSDGRESLFIPKI